MVKTYSKWTGVKRQRWLEWRKEHMESTIIITTDSDKGISRRGESGVYNSEMPNLPQNDKTSGVRGND